MNDYPICCPFCGGNDCTEIGPWKAKSLVEEGDHNIAALTEWQCFDCNNKSFWV